MDQSSLFWFVQSNPCIHLYRLLSKDEMCLVEPQHKPAGPQRGRHRPRTLALPLQHRPLPGRQAHHLCPGKKTRIKKPKLPSDAAHAAKCDPPCEDVRYYV